jgi:hypothetical protein
MASVRLRCGIEIELTAVNPPSYLPLNASDRAPGPGVQVTARPVLEVLATTRTRLVRKADTDISGSITSIGALPPPLT